MREALGWGAGVAPEELDWFFDQWMRRTGAPELELAWSQRGGSVRLEVTQRPPVEANGHLEPVRGRDGGTLDETLAVETQRSVHELPFEGEVWRVDLDPEFLFLHWTPELRAAAEPMGHYLRGVTASDPETALELLDRGLERVPRPDLQATRMFLLYGRGRVHARRGEWAAARDAFLTALQAPTRRADVLPSVYLGLAEVAIELRDRPLFDWALAGVESSDLAAGSVTSAPSRAARLRF